MKTDLLLHAAVVACVLMLGVYMYGNMQQADERARLEIKR